jgi:hypothetical protein
MNKELRLETLINFYFSPRDGFKEAGIRRAYRDFNRTLPLDSENQTERDKNRKRVENLLIQKLNYLLEHSFDDQNDFDKYHKTICNEIVNSWNKLTIGHVQKWVNMTLKYWLLIGEKEIKGIELNYKFFHIPIDSIILEQFFGEKNPPIPWSKINDYDNYFKYQEKLRSELENKLNKNNLEEIPIIYETVEFNNQY